MVEKEILNAVMYQTQNEIWVVESVWWKKYQYEKNIHPIRILLCQVTTKFMDHIQKITESELIKILLEELDSNPETIRSN